MTRPDTCSAARIGGSSAAGDTPLDRARDALERRLDQIARSHAGRPQPVVLDALEGATRRAGVTPRRADLSALARQISRGHPDGS